MKPHQYFLLFIVLIGTLGLAGTLILSGTGDDTITPTDNFTTILKGENYQEYKDSVDEIKVAAEDDGYLAQFKLAKAVYGAAKSTMTQSEALLTSLSNFMGLPYELVAMIILIVIILAVFALIYLVRG